MYIKPFVLIFLAILSVISFGQATLDADLIYNLEPYQLVDENTGNTENILGGTIVMVDGADADAVLSLAEVISITAHTTMGTYTADATEGSVELGTGTFNNGQLFGGVIFLDEYDLDDGFIDWGGGDYITLTGDGNNGPFFTTNVSSPFLVASQAIPEPNSSVIAVVLLGAFLLKRRPRSKEHGNVIG